MNSIRYGLEGRTVVITGAAGGIGQALARAFAGQGAKLMLLDREAAALHALRDELSVHTEVLSAACDLGSDDAVRGVANAVSSRWGRLDVLVNNAGSEAPTPITDTAADANDHWASLLDNNVTSMVRLTRSMLGLMSAGASVINQSSMWGRIGVSEFSAYSASKHAVIGLTRSLALELGAKRIRVNAVCPGWIRTAAAMRSLTAMANSSGRTEAEVEREILSRQAVPEMLTPEELADTFLFLASDGSKALTGQCLCPSHGEVMV